MSTISQRGSKRKRRGTVATWLVLMSGVLLAMFALAFNHVRLWQIRLELQDGADAAALAATGALVDDDLLRGDPAFLPALIERSANEAQRYAALNLVQGRPLKLVPNPSNFPYGDVLFGTLDTPRSRTLTPPENIADPANAALASINVVRIAALLTRERGTAPGLVFGHFLSRGSAEVRAEAAAMLDRDVIGFRPRVNHPLPLAPLGLFSDPSAADPLSWQSQVEAKNGKDVWRFDRENNVFVADPLGDGLWEMEAALALDVSQKSLSNVTLLFLGAGNVTGLSQQLLTGITSDHLADNGGQLVLQKADNRLPVDGTDLGPLAASADATLLRDTLDQLRVLAEPRLWPLYCGLETGTDRPILCGFVAARVVSVDPLVVGQPLRFGLQPTMVANGAAVTDANQRGIGGIVVVNPYICKLRLVE